MTFGFVGTSLLATMLCIPHDGARPEVRGTAGWRADIADMDADGRYLIHWSAPGRDAPIAAIRGNMGEGPDAVAAFAEFLQPEANWQTPGQAAQQCILSEVVTCCGTSQVCENFCWVDVTVNCTNPDGTGGCVVSCFSPGCKDENCGWFGLWCDCPPMPVTVD